MGAGAGTVSGARRRTHADRETLRRRYRPTRIHVLFVGESPPASGRYFYAGDSGLFHAVREAFQNVVPRTRSAGRFLTSFRDLGCALVDLCERPVDRLPPARRRARCRASEARLAREIAEARPRAIVVVVRSIEGNVRRAMDRVSWQGESLALPYPGRWIRHRVTFVATLAAALPRWLRREELRPAHKHASVHARNRVT
jgi:hypothetical protein